MFTTTKEHGRHTRLEIQDRTLGIAPGTSPHPQGASRATRSTVASDGARARLRTATEVLGSEGEWEAIAGATAAREVTAAEVRTALADFIRQQQRGTLPVAQEGQAREQETRAEESSH